MRTDTIVRASADVVRITNLTEGDVYKRLADKDYTGNYKAFFGIVQSVDFNGDDTLISAIEFDLDYNRATPTHKLFGSDSDLKLFAATPEEVELHFQDVKAAVDAKHEAAQRALVEARKSRSLAYSIIEAQSQLKAASTTDQPELPGVAVEAEPDIVEMI